MTTRWERIEQTRRMAQSRALAVAVANMSTEAGLAVLEFGLRAGNVAQARRCARHLLNAHEAFIAAGMSRRAAAISRLLERCRRALVRHHEVRGWK